MSVIGKLGLSSCSGSSSPPLEIDLLVQEHLSPFHPLGVMWGEP
jgi:hypothetical protein